MAPASGTTCEETETGSEPANTTLSLGPTRGGIADCEAWAKSGSKIAALNASPKPPGVCYDGRGRNKASLLACGGRFRNDCQLAIAFRQERGGVPLSGRLFVVTLPVD